MSRIKFREIKSYRGEVPIEESNPPQDRILTRSIRGTSRDPLPDREDLVLGRVPSLATINLIIGEIPFKVNRRLKFFPPAQLGFVDSRSTVQSREANRPGGVDEHQHVNEGVEPFFHEEGNVEDQGRALLGALPVKTDRFSDSIDHRWMQDLLEISELLRVLEDLSQGPAVDLPIRSQDVLPESIGHRFLDVLFFQEFVGDLVRVENLGSPAGKRLCDGGFSTPDSAEDPDDFPPSGRVQTRPRGFIC